MDRLLRNIYRVLSGRYFREMRERQRSVSLQTTSTPARGVVLIAYVLDPFLVKKGEKISYGHTHHHESLLIARAFLSLGYDVDVIDYRNRDFIPSRSYDFFVSARTNLATIADRLNKDCTVIAHLDTSHYLFNNHAAYARTLMLRDRLGIACPSIRLIEKNWAIERADYGIVLGNEATMSTYRYAGKPLYPLTVPSPLTFPFPQKDYAECRRRFLWFGSAGFVHKGLDLVLEAFSRMPDLHLHVCGPIERDRRFVDAFRTWLLHTPNIHTIGWMDISSPEFIDLIRNTVALVYPSCAEGQAGSVVVCLQAGLIPIVSRESGLDIGDYGIVLQDSGIEEICRQVKRITSLPDSDLEKMTKDAWEHARATHGEESYLAQYRRIITEIMHGADETSGAVHSARPPGLLP